MSLLNVNKIDPSTGTALEIGTSGDTITVPSGATFNVAGTLQSGGAGVANTPAFHAYANNSAIAIANDTYTAMPCANDYFDSDNDFNTSTYKFIPQTAGKYYVYANMVTDGNWNTTAFLMVQKNQGFNADDNRRCSTYATNSAGVHVSGMFTMNGSSDYIEARVYQQSGGSLNLRDQGGENYFGGFRIIGA
tara:strand:+ start:13 stop:585 length:573 start_codon:yes stop_codon:yes gene_type:complete